MSPRVVQSGSAFVLGAALSAAAELPTTRAKLGLVTYCFNLAAKHHSDGVDAAKFSDPLVFIQEAAKLGASA